MIATEKSPRCPKFNRVPRIYQEATLPTPINRMTATITCEISCETTPTTSRRNWTSLIERNQLHKGNEEGENWRDLFLSFHVVSLFVNVATEERLEIIRNKYKLPRYVTILNRHYVMHAYFIYRKQQYSLTEGQSIGSPGKIYWQQFRNLKTWEKYKKKIFESFQTADFQKWG